MYPLSIVENIEQTPKLYFLAGEDKDIQIDIITSSDEERGFYGSKILTYISDHGVFLSNTGNNVENTIINHEITEINIASFGAPSFSKEVCPKITLDLDNISNCRTISIGSSSPLYIKALYIVSTSNHHLTSVSLNNITITDTLSFEGVIIDTLSLKEMTITKLSFTDNCTIGKYQEDSSIKVSELNIDSTTFSSEETILSSQEVCKVTINNLTFNTTFTLNCLYLAELSVTSLKGTGDSNTFNNYYLNNYTQDTISITGTMTNIDCIKLNAAWTIPNGQSSSGNNTTAAIKTLKYTIKLGNKGSMPEISIRM